MTSIERTIVRGGSALLVMGAMYFGADQGPRPVYADNPPTPTTTTSTWTATPVLDAVATQVVNAEATLTAERAIRTSTAVQVGIDRERLEKLNRIQEEINALRGTPTKTFSPTPTSTPKATVTSAPDFAATRVAVDIAVVKELADRRASATARAEQKITPSSVPLYVAPTEVVPGSGKGKDQGGSVPFVEIGSIVVALGAVLYAFKARLPLINRIP